MYQINNFTNNDDVKLLDSLGPFTVIEYQKDLSVMPGSAQLAYYCNAMNVRKRQVICDLSKANITLQAGAMQWTVGNVNATTGVKGVGDLFGKALRGSVTVRAPSNRNILGTAPWSWSLPISIFSCWIWPTGTAPSFWTTVCSWPVTPD